MLQIKCALNGNNSGQLAYGLIFCFVTVKESDISMAMRKSARSCDIAKKIISGKKRIYHLSSDFGLYRRGHFFINHQYLAQRP